MSGPEASASGADERTEAGEAGLLYGILNEIISSPLNLALVGVISFLLYKITRSRQQPTALPPPPPEMPRLRRDFTVAELKQYDGTQPDGRVLVAVNGNVYDVTKGKNFYGPGGPYAVFGGRDASRGLATFSVTASPNDEYDDLSDLKSHEMESVREWEMQFKEKYILVGRLLKPGEQPTNYSDEDEDKDGSGEGGPSAVRKRAAAAAAAAKDAVAAAVESAAEVAASKGETESAPAAAEDGKDKAE
ncbi:hypothetical protein ZHAS_00009707 [Anopheles sinensis]|uniref:Cytochrome b5 heme-binding domain-containing protein n=1 Tax=Anopheles sinensis TaxID=74873 RepID=A0A084VV69_ANOSI|nr:hypothetical protein ZHAS_00009707 [Anopheles sinensis]